MCLDEGRIPARVVLGIMVFFMFVLSQMIRTNFNLVVIEITGVRNTSAAINDTFSNSERLGWTRQQSGLLMGAYYWCSWMTEVPGGILATRLGGKRLLLFSVLAAAMLNLAMPLASAAHFWAAVVIRLLQGLALGVSWPAVHTLSAQWIPLVERGKFTATYNGNAIGGAVNNVLSGVLITQHGWRYVFYVTGALSLLWCCAWMFLAHDSPAQHPRISSTERSYLQDSVSHREHKTQKIPWCSILRSGPFWAVLLAAQTNVWLTVTLSMQMPTYLSSVHHLNMTVNGLVSCLPEICKFLFGMTISTAIDSSLKQKKLSVTAARKLAVTVSTIVPGALLVLLGLCAHNTVLAVMILILANCATAANSSGHLANMVDISPNYAGIVMGLVKTVVVIPAALSPPVASLLTSGNNAAAGWQQLFWLTAALSAVGCFIFMFLGSGQVQKWNDVQQKKFKILEAEDLVHTKE